MIKFKEKRIYLDYASATPVRSSVVKAMEPFWKDIFANPSSIHKEGMHAKEKLKEAREIAASTLGARADEIIFTSGGTESNNLAILGFFKNLKESGQELKNLHAITSEIEHSSVLECFRQLEREGLNVTYVSPTRSGEIEPATIFENLNQKTVFVSIMLVNNEIGTIEPLQDISRAIRRFIKHNGTANQKIVLHTDAVQAPLYLDLSKYSNFVDLLSLDSSKIAGPKGIGILMKNRLVTISPVLVGGSQERGLRPGTVNMPLVAGFAEALKCAISERGEEVIRLETLRDYFLNELREKSVAFEINGTLDTRIANNINIYIPGIESEFAVIKLDQLGFAVASESACLLDSPQGSYVVNSISAGRDATGSAIRITMGEATTKNDLKKLAEAVGSLSKYRL